MESLKITIREWENLLKTLIHDSSVTAIAIDALDECEEVDVKRLLRFFKELEAKQPAFRLILSSQEHIKVNLYFKPENLSIVEMTSGVSKDEMIIFIEGQISMAEDLEPNPDFENSILCKSCI